MENQHQKWVNLSYLVVAGLVGYVVFYFALQMVGIYDLETRVRNIELIVRIASVVIFGLVFFVLWRHEEANQFMNEVMAELFRVTWPTQKETTNATIVVVVMVLVSGIALGIMDYFWTLLLKWIL